MGKPVFAQAIRKPEEIFWDGLKKFGYSEESKTLTLALINQIAMALWQQRGAGSGRSSTLRNQAALKLVGSLVDDKNIINMARQWQKVAPNKSSISQLKPEEIKKILVAIKAPSIVRTPAPATREPLQNIVPHASVRKELIELKGQLYLRRMPNGNYRAEFLEQGFENKVHSAIPKIQEISPTMAVESIANILKTLPAYIDKNISMFNGIKGIRAIARNPYRLVLDMQQYDWYTIAREAKRQMSGQ